MKLVIELEVGPNAVKTYGDAIKIIRTQVGRVRSASHLQIAKPGYGDNGPLCDAKSRSVGYWKVDLSGDQRLPTRRRGRLTATNTLNSC